MRRLLVISRYIRRLRISRLQHDLLVIVFMAILSTLFVEVAKAQNFSECTAIIYATRQCEDQGKAAAAARMVANTQIGQGCSGIAGNNLAPGTTENNTTAVPPNVRAFLTRISTGAQACSVTRSYPADKSCRTRAAQPKWRSPGQGFDSVCSEGCRYSYYIAIDPSGGAQSGYEPTGGLCETEDKPPEDKEEPPEPEEPEEPQPPEDCAENDPRPECVKPPDDCTPTDERPECKNDDGDGDGDGGDGTASGGDTCAAPPSCSGNPIQCNQLFQQWHIRCQAEKIRGSVTGDPTSCSGGFICKDNPVECEQLRLLRAQLCKGGGAGGDTEGGTVSGDGNCTQNLVCNGDPIACAALRQQKQLKCAMDNLMSGTGDTTLGADGDPAGSFGISESPLDEGSLDDRGFLSRSQCPALGVSVFQELGIQGIEPLCNGASILGVFVMLLGLIHSAHIVGRSITSGGS